MLLYYGLDSFLEPVTRHTERIPGKLVELMYWECGGVTSCTGSGSTFCITATLLLLGPTGFLHPGFARVREG